MKTSSPPSSPSIAGSRKPFRRDVSFVWAERGLLICSSWNDSSHSDGAFYRLLTLRGMKRMKESQKQHFCQQSSRSSGCSLSLVALSSLLHSSIVTLAVSYHHAGLMSPPLPPHRRHHPATISHLAEAARWSGRQRQAATADSAPRLELNKLLIKTCRAPKIFSQRRLKVH